MSDPASMESKDEASEPMDGANSIATAPISPVLGTCIPVNDFEKVGRIGEGTYGTVYKARDRVSGRVVALKRVLMVHEKVRAPCVCVCMRSWKRRRRA